MAATTAGEMRYEITADLSSFNSAVAQAQASWQRATADMKAQVADTSGSFAALAEGVQETLKGAGASLTEGLKAAMAGSVDGVETATVAMMNGLKKQAEGFWDGFGSLGEKWLGKWGRNLGEMAGRWGKAATDKGAQSLAEKAADAFDVGKIDEANKAVAQYAALIDEATGSAGSLAEKWKAIVEGTKQGLEVFAGKAMSSDQLKAITAELEKQTAQYREQAELVGKSANDRAQIMARRRIEGMDGADKASDTQKEKIDEGVAAVGAAAAEVEAARKVEEQRKGFEYITQYLERQMDLTEARTKELGKSAGAIAEERAMVDAITRMRQKGRDLTDEEADRVQDMAMRWREIADKQAHAQFAQQMETAGTRAEATSQLDARLLGADPGQTARVRFIQGELLRAQEQSISLSDQEIARINQKGNAIGYFAQKAAEAKNAYAELQAVGQVVSRGIEDAFGKMISGTKVNFREMINQIAVDIAKLVLRYQILQPLLGGGASGGGLIAGLMGFGGARAGGGPVSGGTAYMVGERGPELFVPQSTGSIVPNGALGGGGGQVAMTMNVNLQGANGDETIARIAGQAARAGAAAAVAQANAEFPKRQRSYQMLGN